MKGANKVYNGMTTEEVAAIRYAARKRLETRLAKRYGRKRR